MEKKWTRPGRKPLNPKDKRSRMVTLRLRPSEYKELANDAKAADLTVTGLLLKGWLDTRGK